MKPQLALLCGLIAYSFVCPAGAANNAPLIVEREVSGITLHLNTADQVIGIKMHSRFPVIWTDQQGIVQGSNAALQTAVPLPEPGKMLSAALLAQKAKQFDDGMLAAVELAAQNGAGDFSGKAALLRSLSEALANDRGGNDIAIVMAAAILSGNGAKHTRSALQEEAQAALRGFEQNSLAAKPIGFYTWSPTLTSIFRQDRMLQSPLKNGAEITRIALALNADPVAAKAYADYLDLAARMTNPSAASDLRPVMAALKEQNTPPHADDIAFFPASRAYETDLIKKLFGNRPVPDGYSLADDMIARIRDGHLDIAPTPQSGWYDWQTWALETLAAPDKSAEAAHLELNNEYRDALLDLFKGMFAAQRETHIKMLSINPTTSARMAPSTKRQLWLAPQLRVEPLATHYLRRALGYRFVHRVLRDSFGDAALAAMHRFEPDHPVTTSLEEELTGMENLFLGAYAASAQDLGMPADADDRAEAALPHFLDWRAGLADDADMTRDMRLMVPLFYDKQRRKTKVMLILGWSNANASIYYFRPPTLLNPPEDAEMHFSERTEAVIAPITAEVYVDKLLDRNEFRALCDEEKTAQNILAALSKH